MNMDVLPGVPVIAMNNGIHLSLMQCDFNFSFISSKTAAISHQLRAFFCKGRNRSNFAWQRVLKCEGDED